MQKSIVLALSVFTLVMSCWASAGDHFPLRDKLDAFLYGASVNDAAVHNAFWHQDLTYTSSNGTRYGKKALMAGVREAGTVPESEVTTWYTAEDVNIRQLDDVAILTFKLVARSADESQYFLNSGTFVNHEGNWEAIIWQATKTSAD